MSDTPLSPWKDRKTFFDGSKIPVLLHRQAKMRLRASQSKQERTMSVSLVLTRMGSSESVHRYGRDSDLSAQSHFPSVPTRARGARSVAARTSRLLAYLVSRKAQSSLHRTCIAWSWCRVV